MIHLIHLIQVIWGLPSLCIVWWSHIERRIANKLQQRSVTGYMFLYAFYADSGSRRLEVRPGVVAAQLCFELLRLGFIGGDFLPELVWGELRLPGKDECRQPRANTGKLVL